ncbi:MAG: methyltransferase domain-containing protein [Fusobacteriaceae bacterium]
MLICPICKEKLMKEEKRYICKNNHTFDVSRYGHSNLLLSNQKNSKLPGDNKEMVLSRKNFLEKDYYKGISEKVNEVILEELQEKNEVNILDIGCGEGYYTENLRKKMEEKNKKNRILGIDISKEAIISASKSYKNIEWVVASATNIPVEGESLDIILCMFAKIDPEEKMRTLKKGGKLIVVSTGENHLIEMKETVYESVRKEFYLPAEDETLKIFNHKKTVNFSYQTELLEKESIINLFNMTPYRWRSPQNGVEKLFALDKLGITLEVNIDIFEKI